jgi:hypothetical protein
LHQVADRPALCRGPSAPRLTREHRRWFFLSIWRSEKASTPPRPSFPAPMAACPVAPLSSLHSLPSARLPAATPCARSCCSALAAELLCAHCPRSARPRFLPDPARTAPGGSPGAVSLLYLASKFASGLARASGRDSSHPFVLVAACLLPSCCELCFAVASWPRRAPCSNSPAVQLSSGALVVRIRRCFLRTRRALWRRRPAFFPACSLSQRRVSTPARSRCIVESLATSVWLCSFVERSLHRGPALSVRSSVGFSCRSSAPLSLLFCRRRSVTLPRCRSLCVVSNLCSRRQKQARGRCSKCSMKG